MSMIDRIYAQALLLAGTLDHRQETLLRMLCRSAANTLLAKMKQSVTAEDCMGDFIAAASLYALAALSETDSAMTPESFRVGDVTVQKSGSSTAAACLRRQAELTIAPYLADRVSFMRV